MAERVLVIPAVKKNAIIPDQLVKKLAGETLIARALATARAVQHPRDIYVLTDSQEITVICERANVHVHYNPRIRFETLDIVAEMEFLLNELAKTYDCAIIQRASCPLLTWVTIEEAWKRFCQKRADMLVSVTKVHQRLWNLKDGTLAHFLADANHPVVLENRALVILNLQRMHESQKPLIIPFYLGDAGIEIAGYQDWWICERLLKRRHVVFVVAGYPAIGMGHVFRALMLAHEITNHKITFVCTKERELAVENITLRDYPVVRQSDSLAETVLRLHPDLVVNDFLDTPKDYMATLAAEHIPLVNFEDDGPGTAFADLVVNALYEGETSDPKYCVGPAYFCLRDEFLEAQRNPLRDSVKTLLITFGGTDQFNASKRCLDIVEPICKAYGIHIRLVAGPGYAHRESMEAHLKELQNPLVTFTWATNIMSRMMEGCDLAICAAGRTVYELAHMRIPGIVLAHHEREARHTFARPKHGFAFLGLMQRVSDQKIRNVFLAMLKQERRARFWARQNALDFTKNKARVIAKIEAFLDTEKDPSPSSF